MNCSIYFQVLFRYALAIFKSFEEKLLRQNDYMSIFSCFRAELQSLFDIKKLTKIAFQDLNPFPMRFIKNKREHHQKILKVRCTSYDNFANLISHFVRLKWKAWR